MPEGHPAQSHLRAILLGVSARIATEDGELDDADRFAHDAFTAAQGTRDMPIVAAVGVTIAEIVASRGRPDTAAEMLGAAAALRGADDGTAREISALRARLTEALGADEFAARYAAGKALDREAAIERLAPAG
jgi:hypothetical protein